MNIRKNSRESGFTLVEIAIVLIVIGLLLGGVLKGQELINSARVKNIVSQGDAIKAAFYGFRDRYQAVPGDYKTASTNISGVTVNGDGNSRVDTKVEVTLLWNHLAKAGFLSGTYDGTAFAAFPTKATIFTCVAASCPNNAYNGPIMMYWGNLTKLAPGSSHEMTTGHNIPVAIMAEIDRKIDDGLPNAGTLLAAADDALGTDAGCITGATAADTWAVTAVSPSANCGAIYTNN